MPIHRLHYRLWILLLLLLCGSTGATLAGGLIYAARKRQRSVRTEAKLQQITGQLEDPGNFTVIPSATPVTGPLLVAR